MLVYQRLGRPGDVERTYQRCRSALDRTLGVRPSVETERLRAQLQGEA